MPSGDVAQSCTLAFTLGYRIDHQLYLTFFIVPIVMWGRVFYSRHYISDTIIGAILGTLIGISGNMFLINRFDHMASCIGCTGHGSPYHPSNHSG